MPKNERKIVLVYFSDCPNAIEAREILERSGLQFYAVNQDQLSKNDPLLGYSSPSILVNGALIFGSKTHDGARGCSVIRIDESVLIRRLRESV